MHITTRDTGIAGTHAAEKAAAGIERLSAGAHEAVGRAAGSATSAAHQLAESGQRLAAAGSQWAEATRDCVRRHPIASVSVAIGAGVLLSLFTHRSR